MSNQIPQNIGLIGLGAMGAGMASSLRRAGYNVHVYDIRPEAVIAFTADGGVACDSAESVADACPIVISVLVNADQTEQLLFGAGGMAARMQPDSTFVMCSTVDPNWSVNLEQRLEAMGIGYLDAPISGGAAKAASGEMTMMTAGKPAVYACLNGVLEAMAAKAWAIRPVMAAKSRSSTSYWQAFTSRLRLKPWRWVCAKALRPTTCTRSSPTVPVTAGCLKTEWHTS
jgi:putative dehydrogenase